MKIKANGIDIEVEDSGPGVAGEERPAVLLIMGLGMQLVAWPEPMVQALIDAGYRVIRFDNRDVGLSQKMDALGQPSLVWQSIRYKLGLQVRAPYSVADMAKDALGVLDALSIDKAHVVGVSMGGMIAQRMALISPQRLLSLTSVMSSSGAKGLPYASPEVVKVMISRPDGRKPIALLDYYVKLFAAIGSPDYPVDLLELRERIMLGMTRGFHPVGTLRQTLAAMADHDRADQLGQIQVPTLVVHGKADPLVPYPCGEDTARRIPGAKMVGIEGMGHDLAPGVVDLLLQALLPHLKSS